MTKWMRHGRPWAACEDDLKEIRAVLFAEAPVDRTRAETRFAAEVALAELQARDVPSFAHERAVEILAALAKE